MGEETTRRRFGTKTSEKGYILAMAALLLVPLLAFTGFATDVGSWYARASRLQRAADAAALAGVVWQPNFGSATTAARQTLERNGFIDNQNGIQIEYENVGPRQLRVEVTDERVEVYFTSMFFDEVDITRDATAEYLQSLPMGSPDNRMGNDPINPPAAGNPNLWTLIGGHETDKVQGERYASGGCQTPSVPAGGGIVSGCSGTADFGDNADYDAWGYTYAVNVGAANGTQPLNIQVYDPALINQGTTCVDNYITQAQRTNLIGISETTYPTNGMNDANTRYQTRTDASNAPTNIGYCPGDALYQTGTTPVDTTYIVRGPDATPFDSRDNPVISNAQCLPRTFTGRRLSNGTELYQRLNPSDGQYDTNTVANWGREGIRLYEHFRRWYTMCTIPGPVPPGKYYIQVRTNASQSNPPTSLVTEDPSIDTEGQNHFAIRAGWGGSSTTAPTSTLTAPVDVYADGRLPIHINSAQATTSFYLARVTREYAGEVILLNFFDIGDAADGNSVTFSVRPPTEARTTSSTGPVLSNFSGCTITRDGNAYTPSPQANCGVQNMTSTNYQGRTTSVQVPIPTNYWCDESVRTGCWLRVNLTWSTGAAPTDRTTWSAAVLGDPVRLSE